MYVALYQCHLKQTTSNRQIVHYYISDLFENIVKSLAISLQVLDNIFITFTLVTNHSISLPLSLP